MVGLGPMWSKAKGECGKVGTTFVADFMFWPVGSLSQAIPSIQGTNDRLP
jgi:hypothetical protein